jgi:coenzyme F420-reducing hydrogenase gamma subunit
MSNVTATKPTVGIFGLTGCAGDQLVILNCEDELLDLVGLLDVRDFLMAASGPDTGASLDIAFVEGAVASHRDEERLRRIRERSRMLVAIGTCAVWGGVAALDRFADRAALLDEIYGPAGRTFDQLSVRALHEVVPVDLRITGCPIEREEFLAAVACLLNGDPPPTVSYSVCAECRMRENNCLLVERGLPCLGAVTAAGCDARCPALGVPCIGCRGPAADRNVDSLLATLDARGTPRAETRRRLESFGPVPAAAGATVEEGR